MRFKALRGRFDPRVYKLWDMACNSGNLMKKEGKMRRFFLFVLFTFLASLACNIAADPVDSAQSSFPAASTVESNVVSAQSTTTSPISLFIGANSYSIELYEGSVTTDSYKVTLGIFSSKPNAIWLLGHNNLVGAAFLKLQVGDEFFIHFQDSRTQWYKVDSIRRYRAITPESDGTNLVEVSYPSLNDITGQEEEPFSVKNKVLQDGYVTLQTCISKDGNGIWGRLFVIAKKIETK